MSSRPETCDPNDLLIEPATDADLEQVLALYAQPDMDGGLTLSPDDARSLLARIRRIPDYELYVARDRGRIVGTFALLIMPNLGTGGTPSGVVEDVVVVSDRQGQGIGRAMIGEAIRLCSAHGCYKVTLSSNMKRERAHAFYEGLGFERHGYSFRIDIDPSDMD
jgi:GNAT superfamily N-acetyltransferase